MSYINDALKKAQKEKDNFYRHYKRIIESPTLDIKKIEHRSRIITITVVISILLALTVFSLLKYHIFEVTGEETAIAHRGDEKENVMPTTQEAVMASQTGTKLEDAEHLYREALNKQQNNKLTEAKKLYEKILIVNPEFVFAFNNLGVIYMRQNNFAESIRVLKKAIELKGDYVDPYYNLACVYSIKGDRHKSCDYLKMAIQLNSDVRRWAQRDSDLQNIRESIEFKQIMENKNSSAKNKD